MAADRLLETVQFAKSKEESVECGEFIHSILWRYTNSSGITVVHQYLRRYNSSSSINGSNNEGMYERLAEYGSKLIVDHVHRILSP